MKRIKRTNAFEINVDIKDNSFPRDAQRNEVLNREVKEFTADPIALDEQTKTFVPGKFVNFSADDREQKILQEQEIMEDCLIPVMEAMARVIAKDGGDILEIGFGRGISAEMMQNYPIASHTMGSFFIPVL